MASANAGPGVSGTAASHPYTCNTCQVAYRNIDLQKGHMKSDWHRYNLKRRVASLPPISSEVFSEKVIQARTASTVEAEKAYFERACETCSKTYYSENAYKNHLLSQKHKLNLSAASQQRHDDETTSVVSSTFSLGEPTAVARDEVDSDAEDEFNQVIKSLQKAKVSHSQQQPSPVKRPTNPHRGVGDKNGSADDESTTTGGPEPVWTVNSCMFCNYESPTAPLNASHMERFHGMFIPEKPYLADLEGLIKHLQRQVSEAHECLSCGKMKSTVFGVQTHMRDKGHCKIPYTSEAEQLRIGDFYDFRSTYSGGEDDDDDDDDESDDGVTEGENGGAKLGLKREEKVVGADGEMLDEDEDADGWETDSSVSSLDSADLTAVPAEGHIHQFERLSKHPHHSRKDPRNRHQVDGWHSRAHKHVHAVFYDDFGELHLPSGKSVGHRSLNKYYRQNLNSYPTPEERAERLAIEGSGSGSEFEHANGDRRVAVRDRRGREVIPRGALGMTGVSDAKKREVRKMQQRSRDMEQKRTKRNAHAYGTAANNQKGYYYRYDGGG